MGKSVSSDKMRSIYGDTPASVEKLFTKQNLYAAKPKSANSHSSFLSGAAATLKAIAQAHEQNGGILVEGSHNAAARPSTAKATRKASGDEAKSPAI